MALPPASHRLIIIRSPSLALPRLLASSPPPPASPAAARRLSLHPHPPAPSSPSPGLAATAGAPDRRRPKSCYRQRRPFSSHCQGDRTTTVSAQPLPGIPAVRVHVSDLVAPAWTWSACTRARSSNKFRSPSRIRLVFPPPTQRSICIICNPDDDTLPQCLSELFSSPGMASPFLFHALLFFPWLLLFAQRQSSFHARNCPARRSAALRLFRGGKMRQLVLCIA